MINQQCPNLIIVCYPPFAGGKCIINSLGLHDNCLLQHKDHIDFTYQEKLSYLKQALEQAQASHEWTDLGLGCHSFFGFDSKPYVSQYPEIISELMYPEMHEISNGSKYFFLVAHNTIYVDAYLKFWKNAKVIFLQNYRQFIDQRRSQLKTYWDDIRGINWPVDPPTCEDELMSLPSFIKEELITTFGREIYHLIDVYQQDRKDIFDKKYQSEVTRLVTELGPERSILWDCHTNYHDVESYLPQIKKVYNWLGLEIVSTQDLAWYFEQWKTTIALCRRQ